MLVFDKSQRGRAREHLREATKPPRELTLTEGKGQLTFSSNGRRLKMNFDGPPARVSGDQGVGTTQARRQDGKLVMIAQAESGTRMTVFLLSEDGQQLTLDISMASQKLGKPIRYRVTYVRL
jgi:hypothetical protein